MRRLKRRISLASFCLAGAGLFVGFGAGTFEGAPGESPKREMQNISLPDGYRSWRLISVAHEGGKLNDIRAILGNDLAFEASRRASLPFPDGAIIARVAWAYTPSEKNNEAFGNEQSFVAGSPTNVQLLVKDSRKYSTTGGWGFAQFARSSSLNEAMATDCFGCHVPARSNDYVFTHFAP